MTTAPVFAEPIQPLLALLERELDGKALERIAGGPLPTHVWEAALAGPLRYFLSRPGKGFRSRLVTTAYRLCDGWSEPPELLGGLVELLHAGSLIVDDVEDGSLYRRGGRALHSVYGVPLALNAGSFLYFWPFELLSRLELSPDVIADIRRRMSLCLLHAHYGQGLDLSARMSRLAQSDVPGVVRATARLKTGSLMALAAEIGALSANARDERVDALTEFGFTLGEGLQMLDDLGSITNDARCHKGHEDLLLGRPTWPWAWLSEQLDELSYARFQSLAREAEARSLHPEALVEQIKPKVERVGRRRIQEHFQRAVSRLEPVFGRHPAFESLLAEIRDVEQSYG